VPSKITVKTINNPRYLPSDAAKKLLKPPRPSGINIKGPSQHTAAKNEDNTEPILASFSFI